MCTPHPRRRDTLLTGRCDHCDWAAITASYPEMVKSYQDHLRDRHPQAWLRV